MKKLKFLLLLLITLFVYTGQGQTVRVINSYRYADSILDGLIASYQFEDTDTTMTDDLGNNDGTHSGATLGDGNGKGGTNCRVYDGTDDFSEVPWSDDFNIDDTSAVTVMVDFYPTAAGGSGTSNIAGFFRITTSGGHLYHIGHRSNNELRARLYDTAYRDHITTGNTISLNQWSRIIYRWSTGNPQGVTINGGTEITNANLTATPEEVTVATSSPFAISMPTDIAGYADRMITGRVDNVMVWDRRLTDAEITQLNAGDPTYDDLSGQ